MSLETEPKPPLAIPVDEHFRHIRGRAIGERATGIYELTSLFRDISSFPHGIIDGVLLPQDVRIGRETVVYTGYLADALQGDQPAVLTVTKQTLTHRLFQLLSGHAAPSATAQIEILEISQ